VSVASVEADYSQDSETPDVLPLLRPLSQVYYSQVSVASVEAGYSEDSETPDVLPILRALVLNILIPGVSSKCGG
jgi:hypothetical protein